MRGRTGCGRGAVGVRADGERLPSGDDAGLSATTAAGDEYGCES